MDISQLSDALRNEVAYPEQMKCVDSGIHGQGFYPGCQGFSSQKSPHGGLMLLGRDFGVESYYDGLVGSPVRDETALTWRHTREIYFAQPPHPTLSDLPVWCTNYLMGVRLEGSAKGNVRERISMPEWVKYEDTCWGFLQRQVLLQKPLVIVVFGEDNRSDLLTDKRLGRKWTQTIQHTFESDGDRHTASITFADHPHSLISNVAKNAARTEVKRIRALYESQTRSLG